MKIPMSITKCLRKILVPAILAASALLSACSAEDKRTVTLVGYNYTERPIFAFSVNGAGGGNIFVNGGGASFSCCGEVTVGKPAEIKWTYSRTKKQFEAGIQIEHHTTTVTVPEPSVPEAEYLEVHFYPDHHVELALVKFPGKRRMPKVKEDN